MSASADRVAGHPEQREDHAGHEGNDADRPENRYSGDEPDNEKNDAENDQGRLLACDSRRLGRGQKNGLDVKQLKPRWVAWLPPGSGSARLPVTGGLLHFPVFLVAGSG